MMQLPYFGQDLDSKKKVVGILVHVCGKDMPGIQWSFD